MDFVKVGYKNQTQLPVMNFKKHVSVCFYVYVKTLQQNI